MFQWKNNFIIIYFRSKVFSGIISRAKLIDCMCRKHYWKKIKIVKKWFNIKYLFNINAEKNEILFSIYLVLTGNLLLYKYKLSEKIIVLIIIFFIIIVRVKIEMQKKKEVNTFSNTIKHYHIITILYYCYLLHMTIIMNINSSDIIVTLFCI